MPPAPVPAQCSGSNVSPPSVGEVMSRSAEHLRGMHDTPRADCWRCRNSADAELDVAGNATDPAVADR
jgi:hypothetical protein